MSFFIRRIYDLQEKSNPFPSQLDLPVNDVPFGNPADNCVSVKFTNRGNMTAIRVSVTA